MGRPLRTANSAAVLSAGDLRSACRTVALLHDEPAGKICTLTAGAVGIRATLRWHPGRELREPVLPPLPNNDRVRCSFEEETDRDPASLTITGGVRAFGEQDLRRAVDSVLRAISADSALSEAVLEARAVRLASPAVTPAATLEALARDLRDAGFPVSFGRSWSTVTGAEIAIGTGTDSDLVEFLAGHPSWAVLV